MNDRPMRLAWFSPMPPVRSGIAACSADVVRALRLEHKIDVYVDGPRAQSGSAVSAHDFITEHHKQPYDLTVYQLGNSSHHDYIWPYLFRFPGLTVLHDAHLHHARAASLLRTKRQAHYRAEFVANHPGVSGDLSEIAVAGFDTPLLYDWPMTRLVIEASRVTAVHATGMAPSLREQSPGATIETIRLGHGEPLTAARRLAGRERVRRAHGIPENALVFGVFGGLTPEKRVPRILKAFEAVRAHLPGARLLLAGAPASHYDVASDVARRGLAAHVTVTGYIDADDDLTDHLAACDVSLNLRWPTAREMSGPWLRALAAGVPTITMDLEHLAAIPSLDPRTWAHSHPSATAVDTPEAVTVAIDILDEEHSLRLAMRRLGSDAELRVRLGSAGHRYWEQEHTHERMLEDYRRVIALAIDHPMAGSLSRPMTGSADHPVIVPEHLLDSADRTLRALLTPFGLAPEDALRSRL